MARLLSVLGGPTTPCALEDESHRYWFRIWEDPIPRVRATAIRAVARITQAGA